MRRHVFDLVRRLDKSPQAASSVQAMFSGDVLQLRSRLKDLTWCLVVSEPDKHGAKALETLWRKAYHEPVALARQMR